VTLIRRIAAMVAWIRHRDQAEARLHDELQAYVELSAADKVRAGMEPAEARRQARIELGGVEQVKEQVRRTRHGGWLDELGRDLRYAIRLLAQAPAFTAVVVLTLALGIGASTAIFSVVDALLLRWLPVRSPQQLVQISLFARDAPTSAVGGTLSYPIVRMLAEQRDVFASVGGFTPSRLDVGSPDAVARVPAAIVTGGFFETLGLEARVGRLLKATDDVPGAPAVAVISHGYWERQYGGRDDVIGQSILIDGRPVPIVGVTPRGFHGATVGETADITVAAAALPQVNPGAAPLLGAGNFWLRALARPREDVPLVQAAARLDAVWRRLADSLIPPHWSATQRASVAAQVFRFVPGGTGWSYLRHIYRTPLVVLMAIVGVVLLIACANVASLLLARASSRQREMALRLALGAGRWRIVRQLLTEGLVLSIAGGALGTAFAWGASRSLVRLMSTPQLPIAIDLAPNLRLLAFTAAVSVGTALLFAVAPALWATASDPASALSTGTRVSRTRSRWLRALVSGQLALALVLIAAAGLFVRTFQNIRGLDPGFDTDGVVFAELDARRVGPRDLVAEVEQLPGVAAAALATHTPLSGAFWSEPFVAAGRPLPERDTALAIGVGPSYFSALRVRIASGRAFEAADRRGAPLVAIVNDAFARHHYPGQAVVGQRLSARLQRVWQELTIVGVAANTQLTGLRADPPQTVYLPFAQLTDVHQVNLLVRGSGSPGSLARTIEPTVRAALPGMPIELQPLATQVGGTIAQERVLALLAGSFGLIALVLAAVGLYGLIAYGVAQRTPELGVRLALGARRRQVVGLVLGDAMRLVAVGVGLGLPLVWAASRWVRTLLFGVSPADPLAAGGSIAVLVAAALAAAYLPARRAARTDPLVALRHE
jgi:putative ABC transport system permease protein